MDADDVVAINGKRLSARDFQEKAALRGGSLTRISFAVVVVCVAIDVILQVVFLARGVRLVRIGWNVLLVGILFIAVFCRYVLPRLVGRSLHNRYSTQLGTGAWPLTVFRDECVDVVRDDEVAHRVAYSQVRSTRLTPNLYILTFRDGTWLAVRRDGFTQGTLADVRTRVEQLPVGG